MSARRETISPATAPAGRDLQAAFEARMKEIAEETYRAMASAGDMGAVKVKNAAGLLDMCESRVRTLIAEGKLKVVRPTDRTIRIPLSEIRRFLEGQQ